MHTFVCKGFWLVGVKSANEKFGLISDREGKLMRSKVRKTIGKLVTIWGMALAVAFGMPDSTLQAEAATKAQLKEFREELKTMILTADSSVHNVAKYNMTYQESYSVWRDLKETDCKFACNTGMIYEKTSRNSKGILQTYQIMNIDDDFLNRYQVLCASVDEVMSGIDEEMSDLEKVLYIHEYLMETAYFKKEDLTSHSAGGPLGKGYGVCQGYSNAMNLLLGEVGIQSVLLNSVDMNHVWNYMNLDGVWYHTDVLWDDSSSKQDNSECEHSFFLRNDKEFQNIDGYRHYNWYSAYCNEPSTSTRFSNWFVHDVKGIMRYYEGFWYFQSGNSIMKAKIDGTEMSEVLKDTSTVMLNTIEDGVIYYTVNDTTKTFKLTSTVDDDFAQIGSGMEWSFETVDWTNIDYWQLGHYRPSDGKYGYYKGRICLKEKLPVNANEYKIQVAENKYHVLIREYNSEGVMVQSNNLTDGAVFTPTADTVSVGIGLYNTADENVTYSEYKNLLLSGAVSVTPIGGEKLPEVDSEAGMPDSPDGAVTPDYSGGTVMDLIGEMKIENWQDGYYDYVDASYKPYRGRICMKEFVQVADRAYKISVTDSGYHVLIRELDADKKFICTADLKDGDVFVPKKDTAYIAINLYNENTRDITYAQYGTLMETGFQASIIPTDDLDVPSGTELLGQMNIAEWQAGHYDWIDASYTDFQGRICRKEFVQIAGGSKIKASVSKEGYRILIRELDSNKRLLQTDNLLNGDEVTLQKDTVYLAISVYNENEKAITLEQYGTLFANGFTVGLTIL